MAECCGAAAQTGQRVGLAQGTADRAGQFRGLLVTRLSLGGLTNETVKRPCLIKHLSPTAPVAKVAVERQALPAEQCLQVSERGRISAEVMSKYEAAR